MESMKDLLRNQIYVLAFVHTEYLNDEKVYERRDNRCAFRDPIEAYNAAEHEAERMLYAYENRNFDVMDSDPVIGLVRYENNNIRGVWNFYIDELPIVVEN